jgi:DNA excision repair protein ERCC-2
MAEQEKSAGKTEVSVGVRALAEHGLRRGDLVFGFAGAGRALEGIRAHQRIQKMRPAPYRPEVPVSFRIDTEDLVLVVSGRIDGVLETEDQVLVEEIKTTSRAMEDLVPSPLHLGQVKIYAYLYAAAAGQARVTTRLTYCQLDTGALREFDASWDRDELEQFFNDLADSYLQWIRTRIDWQCRRTDSILGLDFPFDQFRPGQRSMAVAVYRAVTAGKQLLVQAATGIGKTMAAVFPALKAMGEGETDRIFYLTARTTGRTVAEKAFEHLRRKGLRIKVLTLTAKDRICFNPDNACHPDECEYARGYYDRAAEAASGLFSFDAITRETLTRAGREHRVCPFELSLDMALWADVIICDYNYAFDPRVYLRRFFSETGEHFTFLVDEAHNLVDRSRAMFSAEIRKQAFLDARREIGKGRLPGIYRAMGKINAWLVQARKRCEAAGGWYAEENLPDDLLPLLRRFMFAAERWLTRNIRTDFRPGLLDLYFAVSGFVRVAERYDDSYSTCFQFQGKDLRVKLFCMNPAGRMAEAMERCQAAVFFSATLTPFDYYRNMFGCRAEALFFTVASPFPPAHLGLMVAGSVSTLYRDRQQTVDAVCRCLAILVGSRKGNYLLFFPSYAYLELVRGPFSRRCPEVELLVQRPDMTERDKEAFLVRFDGENQSTLAGLVVMGGIFGEGIDLAGDRLSGAAVIGVGLPGISPEQELVRGHFQARCGAGFEYAYQYPGFTRVMQAAGRVIRSGTDRGVVLLIDRRFATRRYVRLFPETWQPMAVANSAQLERSLVHFWATNAP